MRSFVQLFLTAESKKNKNRDQVVQGFIQSDLENLQEQRLQNNQVNLVKCLIMVIILSSCQNLSFEFLVIASQPSDTPSCD